MDWTEHWLEIATAVYLVGMILYGHHKGFIRLAVSLASMVLTLAVVYTAMPYATQWLKENTPVYGMIQDGLVKAIWLDEKISLEETGRNAGENGEAGAGEETDPGTGTNPGTRIREGGEGEFSGTPEMERMIIEELHLPRQIKNALIENNNGETYQELGVQIFRDYVCGFLANTAIRVLAFALLFFLVYIILHILVVWLDLVAKLPILSGMNHIAGALLGGVEALISIWIACLVLTGFSGTEFGMVILDAIDASRWLSFLYYNNMLAKIGVGVLGVIL